MDNTLLQLLIIYSSILLGMALTSWLLYRGMPTRLMKLIFQFWCSHIFTVVANAIIAINPKPSFILLNSFFIPPMFLFTFGIMKEFYNNLQLSRWYWPSVILGYIIGWSLWFRFHHFALSACFMIYPFVFFGIHSSLQFSSNVFKDGAILEKVLTFFLFLFILHLGDWPFTRMNGEYVMLAYSIHIFNIIGFAIVLPTLALSRLSQVKVIELEKIVDERTEQLLHQSRLSALGEMAAGIAHEINNPLSIIVGKVEQLLRKNKKSKLDPASLNFHLRSISEMAFRISRIIKGLQDFSHQEASGPLSSIKVLSVLEEILPFCQERFLQNNINFAVEGELDARVNARPLQLSQVFLNLLNNAFDATEGSMEKWIKIVIKKEDDVLLIQFCDSGHGIVEANQHKLMVPFFTTKPVGKGTGLGLSISQRIIKDHKGILRVDSLSSPTIFTVELPFVS